MGGGGETGGGFSQCLLLLSPVEVNRYRRRGRGGGGGGGRGLGGATISDEHHEERAGV